MRRLICALIQGYRWLLSPVLGRHCRFHPSCSSYALAAFRDYPLWQATRLSVRRLLRCHPWHPGGYDPLPTTRGTPMAGPGDAAEQHPGAVTTRQQP
jgi:putative membrane protein insertion efficiency factor